MEEKIFYNSTNDINLCGLLNRTSNNDRIVIMCHGIRGNKDERQSFKLLAQHLYNHNISSFRFDFRAHGESSGKDNEMTIKGECKDVEATINMLMQKGFKDFILLGASFGASIISLINYSEYNNVKGLILWYGALDYNVITDNSLFSMENWEIAKKLGYFTTKSQSTGKEFKFGLDLFKEVNNTVPYKKLMKNDIPKLFVHGIIDKSVPCELSEKVSNMCNNSELILIEEGDHTFNNSDKALKEAINSTIDFVEKIFK